MKGNAIGASAEVLQQLRQKPQETDK